MRKYGGDLVAIAAIVAGALGSYVLYQRTAWTHTEHMTRVVGPQGLILLEPDGASGQTNVGSKVLRFRTVEPAGAVYLVRSGQPDVLVRSGSEMVLEDGLFHGSFRRHHGIGQIRLQVEVRDGDKVTDSGTVSSLRPHIDVTRGGISIFGF